MPTAQLSIRGRRSLSLLPKRLSGPAAPGGSLYPQQTRATEDGDVRITEDGELRVIESTAPTVNTPIPDSYYYGNKAPVVANTIGVQIYTPV